MKIRNALLLFLTTLGLLACARDSDYRPPPPLPPPNIVADMPAKSLVSLRVILQFKETVAYADPAFVITLQSQSNMPMQFITTVAANTYVYAVQVPANEEPATVLQRLSILPIVARAEIDVKVKSN